MERLDLGSVLHVSIEFNTKLLLHRSLYFMYLIIGLNVVYILFESIVLSNREK